MHTEYVELFPMIWLVFICFVDLMTDLNLYSFFCESVFRVERKKAKILGDESYWKCECKDGTICKRNECPIFFVIDENIANLDKKCPKIFSNYYGVSSEKKSLFQKIRDVFSIHRPIQRNQLAKDVFWHTIKDGFIRFHQATYFEIIFIQFAIIALLSEIPLIQYGCGIAAVVIASGPYFFLSHSKKTTIPQFADEGERLILAIIILFIMMGIIQVEVMLQ